MSDTQLTIAEERVVAGTPEMPAACEHCLSYSKVFNVCGRCGRDERARFGCKHRLGVGDICDLCRAEDIQKERVETLFKSPQELQEVLDLLQEFLCVKLDNNRNELLRLQARGVELLSQKRQT